MPKSVNDLLSVIKLSEDQLTSFIRDELNDESVETFFGKHAADIRQAVSAKETAKKKGDSLIIVLPGIMGSLLEDVSEDGGVIWINPLSFLKGELNHLDLTPDGLKDATAGVNIQATRPVWLAYAKLLLSLQSDYEVYSFPYDWRRAPSYHSDRLTEFIDEKLKSSHHKQVTLVGHSMGGLVIMHYLIGEKSKAHAAKNIKRVVTLGTPYRGSIEAVVMLSKADNPKLEIARKLNGNNDAPKLLRTLPGAYHLLPAPNNLYPDWKPMPDLDIWNAETWKQAFTPISEAHLKQALQHHQTLAAADPQVPIFTIIGTHYATATEIPGKMLKGIPKYTRDGLAGGDGTVPVPSATFKDRPKYFVNEEHTELVLESAIIEGIKSWAEGGSPSELVQDISKVVQNDTILRAAAPGVSSAALTDKAARKINADDLLDYEDIQTMFLK